jgi:hypothetical protein
MPRDTNGDDRTSSIFQVRFDGVRLPRETEMKIADAIQRAALLELASLDMRAHGAERLVIDLAPDWGELWGFHIGPVDRFPEL